MERIYLIGYMGSGKTTIGSVLAQSLNWSFIDLDELITNRSGKTVPEIFNQYGETVFRELEASALHSTFHKSHIVIATGGGTPCFYENLEKMKEHGSTIYLNVSVDELIRRLTSDPTIRPLVSGKTPGELGQHIQQHLSRRLTHYNKADYIVDADKEAETIILKILNLLKIK